MKWHLSKQVRDDLRGSAVGEQPVETREVRIRLPLRDKCFSNTCSGSGTMVLVVPDNHDAGNPNVESGLNLVCV